MFVLFIWAGVNTAIELLLRKQLDQDILEEVVLVRLPASSGVAHLWYECDQTVIRPKDNEHRWSKPASIGCPTVHYGHYYCYYYCNIYIVLWYVLHMSSCLLHSQLRAARLLRSDVKQHIVHEMLPWSAFKSAIFAQLSGFDIWPQ